MTRSSLGRKTSAMQVGLVDGEQVLASSVISALRRRGHVVRQYLCAEELLATGALPDVLICETRLDGMSGFELLELLAKRGSLPHTIVTTSQASLENCRRAMRLGVKDFLSKPFRLDELVSGVDQAVATRRALDGDALQATYAADRPGADSAIADLLAFAIRKRLQPSVRSRIGTACAEIIDNALRHAYSKGAGDFSVAARLSSGTIKVTIADEGAGFDPVEAAIGPLQDSRNSGLARAAALCEDFRLESPRSGGARVLMSFGTYPAAKDGDERVDLSDLDYLTPRMVKRVLSALLEEAPDELIHLSPPLAIAVGRLLAGNSARQNVNTALWT